MSQFALSESTADCDWVDGSSFYPFEATVQPLHRSDIVTTPDKIDQRQPLSDAATRPFPKRRGHPVQPRPRRSRAAKSASACTLSYTFHWTNPSHRRDDWGGNGLHHRAIPYLKSARFTPVAQFYSTQWYVLPPPLTLTDPLTVACRHSGSLLVPPRPVACSRNHETPDTSRNEISHRTGRFPLQFSQGPSSEISSITVPHPLH